MDETAETLAPESRLADTLKSLRGVIRRRWLTLLLVSAAVFLAAAVLIFLMVPRYEATARLQIDPTRSGLSQDNQVRTDLGSEAIETEVTVLNSEELARAVVAKLNLGSDPEFTKGLDNREEAPLSAEERVNAVARRVRANLQVRRDRLTYVILVSYSSRDAEKAARIANAYAETYINTRVGSRVGTAERQSAFFRKQLNDLGNQVRAADAAVAQYRARAGITEGSGSSTITDQQIAPLSTQLATAESEAAEARSNLAAARQQTARGGMDAITAVRNSAVISDLRRQRAEVLRAMGEVNARYGEKYSETIKVREQLAGLDAQIRDEAQRVVASLSAEAGAAEARASSLRSTLRQLEADQSRNTRASVNATSLEREAATKRAAYDRLSQLSLESTQGASNQIANATIIDPAIPPSSPAKPNRSLLLALAAIVALAIGSAAIIVQEMLVSGLRGIDDFEARFGVPVIAAVPAVKRGTEPADVIVDKPTSLYAESIRMARASVLGVRSSAPPPRIIALTSAVPGEGKTTVAISFARALAMNGVRTLLIDCDMRRASVRGIIGHPSDAGLVEVLKGEAGVAQAIVADRVPQLDVLAIRQPYFNADEIMSDERFGLLLKDLDYDQIVLDLPPLTGVAEARFTAALADAVVLIVEWGKTPVRAVESALRLLRNDNSKVVGAMFTKVDPTAEAIGGTYYSSKYSSYYQAA